MLMKTKGKILNMMSLGARNLTICSMQKKKEKEKMLTIHNSLTGFSNFSLTNKS